MNYSQSISKNWFLLIMGVVIPLVMGMAMQYGIAEKVFILSAGLLFCTSLILNFNFVYGFFVCTIFLPYSWFLHASVYFSVIVAIVFLINITGYTKEDFKIPLKKAFVIYIISILPSLYNSVDKIASLGSLYNLIGMSVIALVTYLGLSEAKKIGRYIDLFLLGVFVNSVYVIYYGITTGSRVFGFSGIFYVDFVGLGSVLLAIKVIYSKGFLKLFYGLVFLIFIAGLLITQTRNAWLSFGIAFILLVLFLLFKYREYFISRKAIITYSVIIFSLVIVIYFGVSISNSSFEKRLNESSQAVVLGDNTESVGSNSLITRAFIWHTAFNAFLKHPVIGIGIYSFPFSSNLYYTIPKKFFKEYVQNRTAHVSFIAVLTETGILGFTGFIIFLIAILRLVYKNLKKPQSEENVNIYLMINWTFIYIMISLFMTDAWLWGQQIMIMGMFLGFLLSQNRNNPEN